MRKFPERDWKKLRAIQPKALHRFCADILDELHQKSDPDARSDAHETYLDIYRTIHDRDELLSVLFDDWRRSTAVLSLMGWASHGLPTEEEFAPFSDETRARVMNFGDVIFYEQHSE
jgi:hypothetical protein